MFIGNDMMVGFGNGRRWWWFSGLLKWYFWIRIRYENEILIQIRLEFSICLSLNIQSCWVFVEYGIWYGLGG